MSDGMWQAQVGDREQWEAEHCENHSDRHGELRIDLPSIGVRRYLCDECNDRMLQRFDELCDHTRIDDIAQWQRELRQGCEDRRQDMLDAYPSQPLRWRDK